MPARRVIWEDLHPSIDGAIIRDRETGDWLIIAPTEIRDLEHRRAVVNALLAQLDQWDEEEARALRPYIHRLAG